MTDETTKQLEEAKRLLEDWLDAENDEQEEIVRNSTREFLGDSDDDDAATDDDDGSEDS